MDARTCVQVCKGRWTTLTVLYLTGCCTSEASSLYTRRPYYTLCIEYTMYRDGTFYIVLLLGTVAALLCINLAPEEVSSLLQIFHQLVYSNLTSHILLNLRAAAARSSDLSLSDFLVSTPIAFETPDIALQSGWDDELNPDEWPESRPELDVRTMGGGHAASHVSWPSQSHDDMGEAAMSHVDGNRS
ncbi:hypothetical protein C8Q73DRAFT_427482 [Cubamyces lactineus]|nr:hypothetical protein C8Q73DRAFT_427482 [Cubamyces lactineus]